jgi:hypothetical protein
VLRLITDYKRRAANDRDAANKAVPPASKVFELENIHLLDRELARIDLLLSGDDGGRESWMAHFGLPEMLMLFEKCALTLA